MTWKRLRLADTLHRARLEERARQEASRALAELEKVFAEEGAFQRLWAESQAVDPTSDVAGQVGYIAILTERMQGFFPDLIRPELVDALGGVLPQKPRSWLRIARMNEKLGRSARARELYLRVLSPEAAATEEEKVEAQAGLDRLKP